jgi:hypothetical protein
VKSQLQQYQRRLDAPRCACVRLLWTPHRVESRRYVRKPEARCRSFGQDLALLLELTDGSVAARGVDYRIDLPRRLDVLCLSD